MSYPVSKFTEADRIQGVELDCQFSEDIEDGDIVFVEGKIWLSVDPITDTISFAMDDREFAVKRQVLADAINAEWKIEQEKIDRFMEEHGSA